MSKPDKPVEDDTSMPTNIAPGQPSTAEKAVEAMNILHVEIGEKAANLALAVLESVKPEDIPVASAVSLLKFGVELQRKALLGAEDDAGDDDPFDALAKALTGGQDDPPKEGK